MRPLLLALLAAAALTAQFQSPARYPTEADAVARAAEIDAGRAELLGPDAAVVSTHSQVTIRFHVGRAGLATGGGLRIATAHDFGWDIWGGARLQTDDAAAPNFLAYRTSSGSALRWTFYPQGGAGSLFGPVLGTGAFIAIEEFLSGLTVYWQLYFGLFLVLVVLFGRGGLHGFFEWLFRRRS